MREREALAEWLGDQGFTHWFTCTFGKKWPDGPSPAAVMRHTRRFLETHPEVGRYFLVVERGKSGQMRCHAHGLAAPADPSLRIRTQWLWKRWGERYGRSEWNRIREDSEGGKDLRWYLTKYVTKGAERSLGDLTWDMGGGRDTWTA